MEDKKFLDKLQEKLALASAKVSSNPYILSIRDGMLAYMPFTFIASIFLIIAYPPVPALTDLISNIVGVEYSQWMGKLLYVSRVTLSVSALLVSISLSKSLATKLKVAEMPVILTSVVSFLLLTPQVSTDAGSAIQIAKIGSEALFLAMIVGIATTKIYQFIDSKNLKIKMPDAVPPAVSAPFESIIPSFIIVLIFWVVRVILEVYFDSSALVLINSTIGMPIKLLGGSVFGVAIAKIVEQLLWFFGIHGGSIVSGVMSPVFQVLEDANKAASLAGQPVPNIICASFYSHFASIGIVGSVIAIIIASRSKRYREMGKIAGVPYLFNIGEPALFGIPLMLNVTFMIPFVFTNALSVILAYLAFASGIVPIPTGLVQVPWTTPPIISGYLVTGSVMGGLLQLALITIATLIWIPFIKMEDKKLIKEEGGLPPETGVQSLEEA